MKIPKDIADQYIAARKVIEDSLIEFRLQSSNRKHNRPSYAEAILARLASHDPPLLIETPPKWLDEPIGDGWYWIEPLACDEASQYPGRFKSPRQVAKSLSSWHVSIPNIGGGSEHLMGRRVAPCTGRPE
jgi:hypothetical protein